MGARLLIGDVHERLREIPDGSVDLLVTSPPFLALRSYLPADHPNKTKEIGSEPTPAAFLDTLLELTAEFRRVLAPHGSICVELGDTYAGSGGGGGDYLEGGWREGQPGFGGSAERQRDGNAAHWRQKNAQRDAWPLDKCLTGIPGLYTNSLAYGWNMADPWNGKRYEPWRIRNLLTWCRPNPPVGALGDKFRPATSFVTVATTARDRWFDLDAVRTEYAEHTLRNAPTVTGSTQGTKDGRTGTWQLTHAGAPPLDWDAPDNFDQQFADALDQFLAAWWQPLIDLPTAPYKGAHYATFPPELPRRLIEAMCPREVCRECGTPRRRITDSKRITGSGEVVWGDFNGYRAEDGHDGRGRNTKAGLADVHTEVTTLGWTDCGHDNYRPGLVLDPFCGSGTTLAVAVGCGRDAIGIDLDPRNADLARERCGMFLEVVA